MSRSFGSVRVFWLDRDEAVERLRRAAARLVELVPAVEAVYLFGSLAEGRAVPGSDADVLVVMAGAEGRWFDRPLALPDVFGAVGLPVDVFCYSPEELERVPLARRAVDGGMLLAARRTEAGAPGDAGA